MKGEQRRRESAAIPAGGRTCPVAGPGAPPSAWTSIRPPEQKGSKPPSPPAPCCGPGTSEGAEPSAPGRAGQTPRPGPGRTAHPGRRESCRLTCLMYMFAEDGLGPPRCRSACPHRSCPVPALGLTAGLRRRRPPPQPPPAPRAGPAHPSRKQNGGGPSPFRLGANHSAPLGGRTAERRTRSCTAEEATPRGTAGISFFRSSQVPR